MKFPLTSSTRIQHSSAGANYYEAIFSTADGSGILFDAPLPGTVEMRQFNLGHGSFWLLVYQPTEFPEINIPGWVAPKPKFLTLFIGEFNENESARRNVLRQLITDHRLYIGGSISVEVFDDTTGESIGSDEISLSDIPTAVNHIYERFWARGISAPISVTATQFIASFSGRTETRMGLVISDGDLSSNSFWMDTDEYFQRMHDFENFTDIDTASFPYTRRDAETATNQINNNLNVGGLVSSSGTFPTVHIEGGLQRLNITSPLLPELRLPISLVYYSQPERDSETVISIRVFGGTVSDFNLEIGSTTIPLAASVPLHISGDNLAFGTHRRDVEPREGRLVVRMGSAIHQVHFKLVDNIIDRVYGIARHVKRLKDDHLRWQHQESVSGISNGEAVMLYSLIQDVIGNESIPDAIKREIRSSMERTRGSRYFSIHSRMVTFRNRMRGNILTSRNSLRTQVFEQPFLKDQLISNPTEDRLAKYFFVINVLRNTTDGNALFDEHYRGFIRGTLPSGSYALSSNDLAQIGKKSSELYEATLNIGFSFILMGLKYEANSLIRSIRRSGHRLDGNSDFSAFTTSLVERCQEFDVELNFEIRSTPHGVEEFIVTDTRYIGSDPVASPVRAPHFLNFGTQIMTGVGVFATIAQTISDPNLRNVLDSGTNLAAFVLSLGEYWGERLFGREVGFDIVFRGRRIPTTKVLGVATALVDVWGYLENIDEFALRGDSDAEWFARLGAAGSSVVALGEGMTMTVVAAPLGMTFIAVGTMTDWIAAIGILATADSELSLVLQNSIFGDDYDDVRDNPVYAQFHQNVPLQMSYLLSKLYPISGNLRRMARGSYGLQLGTSISLYSKASRVYIEFKNEGTMLHMIDFQLQLDRRFTHHDRSYYNANSWLRLEIDPPAETNHHKLGITFKIRNSAPFNLERVTLVALIVSQEELTSDNRSENYIPTNEFILRYPVCTRKFFLLE